MREEIKWIVQGIGIGLALVAIMLAPYAARIIAALGGE